MSKVYDVVAVTGNYTDKNGEEKAKWTNCGAIFETKNGLALKLDVVPIGGEGWFKLFEPKKKERTTETSNARTPHHENRTSRADYMAQEDPSDPIPF